MVKLAWGVGVVLILDDPLTVTTLVPQGVTVSDQAWLEGYLQPTYVHLDDAAVRIFVTLVITAILSVVVLRSRRLLIQQVDAARQRANLARYLDPALVEQLAGRDQPLGQIRTERLVVLFADMQGFTRLAEAEPPERVIDLLREFHGRLAAAVFAHGGSIDKFIGDAQMAVFGLTGAGPDDAARALACAEAIQASVLRWNDERGVAGAPPVAVGIGLHLGDAVLGDIGGGERFEFAVIGDAVNVAARLERLTRELATPVVISGAIAAAVEDEALLARYRPLPARALRGREAAIDVWVREPLTPPHPTP
jgi:adenylate cyclase